MMKLSWLRRGAPVRRDRRKQFGSRPSLCGGDAKFRREAAQRVGQRGSLTDQCFPTSASSLGLLLDL